MVYNSSMKRIILLLVLILGIKEFALAEDLCEVDLNANTLKIHTQTQNDILKQQSIDLKNDNPQLQQTNNYNPDYAYSKKSVSYKKEKKFKKFGVGMQYDTNFTPEKASQTRTLYTKIKLNEKASVNTSYSTNADSQSNNFGQINGTVSVTPEYRFNKHLSVQNKFSRNTSNGMSKEEVDIKVNPFKDTDRMDLSAGVGQVQYTNGSPSSSQINFGANFKF